MQKQKHNKIVEQDLRQYIAAGVVNGARIVETAAGYILVVSVGANELDMTLYSYRNKPRAWASLDTMVKYLAEVMPTVETYLLMRERGASVAAVDAP